MSRIARSATFAVLLSVAAVLAETATRPATRPTGLAALAVDGEVDKPFRLSLEELKEMPRHTVKVTDHAGKPATYEGVLVRSILRQGGIALGNHQLRGEATGLSVIVRSADGYRVAFGLAEFDDDYAEREILLADTRDGRPLDAKEGPLRVIVPQEARQGRWARQVTGLTVVPPPKQ